MMVDAYTPLYVCMYIYLFLCLLGKGSVSVIFDLLSSPLTLPGDGFTEYWVFIVLSLYPVS